MKLAFTNFLGTGSLCNSILSGQQVPNWKRLFYSNQEHQLLCSSAPAPARPKSAIKYNRLGSSELVVSEVCLGTMTWGMQNSEEDAHAQLDYAISRGVNFIDTAEMYPAPPREPGQVPGTTEHYIGSYLAKNPHIRSELIIASKVAGFGRNSRIAAHRSQPPMMEAPLPDSRHDAKSIYEACAASLVRLKTEYIDLYQLHWPDRYVPSFGRRAYDPNQERESVPIREVLLALKHLLKEGKIRAYGLSNETSFGVHRFTQLADELDMPRPASIQNPFCLLDRQFESDLAETCAPSNCNVGLLPWSILAGGTLTGKYLGKLREDRKTNDESLRNFRFVKYPAYQIRFTSPAVIHATEQYARIAAEHGMSLATLAQAFCKSRWYIPSSIIGATRLDQLKENIDAFDVDLNERVLEQIDEVHNANKDPILTA